MATRNIVPRSDNEGSLGTSAKKWATAFINTVTLSGGNAVGQTDAIPSPGAYGETAPNTLRATNKEIFVTADSSLTAAQCSRTVVSNYGMTDANCTINLPAAAAGLLFMCVLPTVQSKFFKLRADTNDKIYLSGTAGSDHGYVGVASGYATGSAISMFTFKASDGNYDWFAAPVFGSWVAS